MALTDATIHGSLDNLKMKAQSNVSSEMEVDEIIGERKSGRSLEYLVRWKGFGPTEDSWEPVKNLKNAKEAIQSFHDKTQQLKKSTRKKSRSRSRSRSLSRRTKSKSPARSKRSTSRSRAKASTVTTITSSPSSNTAKTETVVQSPGRFEKTTETITRSVQKPAEIHQYSSVTKTSEFRSSSRPFDEPISKPKTSQWVDYICAPWTWLKNSCQGLVRSDYPALVVFATVSIIMLSFLLEKHVDFEKIWQYIVGTAVAIWGWLTQLVYKKD